MSLTTTAPAVCAPAACYFYVHVKCTENVLWVMNILDLLSLTAEVRMVGTAMS
jgi:hypothetical protein